jgi:hypothetical protein
MTTLAGFVFIPMASVRASARPVISLTLPLWAASEVLHADPARRGERQFGVACLAGRRGVKVRQPRSEHRRVKGRVRKTVEFVQSVPAAQLNGSEDKDIGAVLAKS